LAYAPLQAQTADEQDVQASLIEKIMPFVEGLEPGTNLNTAKTLSIGVLVNICYQNKLQKLFANPRWSKTRIEFKKLEGGQSLKGLHVLLIGTPTPDQLKLIVSDAQKHKVLTLGSLDNSERQGIIINFYRENKKLKFEINLTSAKKSGIHISSLLLNAVRVYTEE